MTESDLADPAFNLTALLRQLAWSPSSGQPGRYEVWSPGSDEDTELIVPTNPQSGDYSHLLERARGYLLRRYGSEAERIEAMILMAASADLDATRWKKQSVLSAGLISWAQGREVFEAAEESLRAAARAARSKRAIQGKSSAYLAKRFMEQVVMGQTEVGSFIVTAHVPASMSFHVSEKSERESTMDARKADTVAGRVVVDILEESVTALKDTLAAYRIAPRIEPFKDLVHLGVSVELIQALAKLARDGDSAVSIQRGEASATTKEISFDAIDAPVLEQVAAGFARTAEPTAATLTGEVSLLDNSTAAPVHIVRLDVMRGADIRRVRVRLSPEQYDLAVAAHADKAWLTLSGTLEKDGRDWWLYHARDVTQTPQNEGPIGVQQTVFDEGGSP